jgi:hypothetical protein
MNLAAGQEGLGEKAEQTKSREPEREAQVAHVLKKPQSMEWEMARERRQHCITRDTEGLDADCSNSRHSLNNTWTVPVRAFSAAPRDLHDALRKCSRISVTTTAAACLAVARR